MDRDETLANDGEEGEGPEESLAVSVSRSHRRDADIRRKNLLVDGLKVLEECGTSSSNWRGKYRHTPPT